MDAVAQNWSTQIQGADIDLPLIRSWPTKYGSSFTAHVTDVSGVNFLALDVQSEPIPEPGDGVVIGLVPQCFQQPKVVQRGGHMTA